MTYIVFDMEWNQPSSKEQKITEPATLYGEVIQIGAVKLNEQFNITDTFNQIVKPVYYVKMNSVVKKLTGIGDERLSSGIPFPEAYERFMDFCTDDFSLLSWGNDDIHVLKANMTIHGITTDRFPTTYNIQQIFGRQIAKTKKQISLERAIEMLDEPSYCAHDALNDAISAARVCRHLDLSNEPTTYKRKNKKKKIKALA